MTYSTKLICERVSPNVNSKHEFDIEEADTGKFFYAVAEIYRALGYLNEFTVKIDSPARDGGITVSFTEGFIELVEPEFDFDRAREWVDQQQGGEVEPAVDCDGWMESCGGQPLVEDGSRVLVKLRGGGIETGLVSEFCWRDDGDSYDIIAYKVVEE